MAAQIETAHLYWESGQQPRLGEFYRHSGTGELVEVRATWPGGLVGDNRVVCCAEFLDFFKKVE